MKNKIAWLNHAHLMYRQDQTKLLSATTECVMEDHVYTAHD